MFRKGFVKLPLSRFVNGAVMMAVFAILISCSGGSDSPSLHFSDGTGGTGMQGDVGSPPQMPGTQAVAGAAPPVGVLPSAPLGTDPEFSTQEISELIETAPVSDGTSSLRSASETPEGRVLWCAISKRGEDPTPGQASIQINEGDKIDLHIRYLVFEGELTISRQWIMEAAGLNYVEPAVTHETDGTYHATFPFTMPYGTGTANATIKGVVGPQRSTSLVVIPDMNDYREEEFAIDETPTLPPIYFPEPNPDEWNDTSIHGKGCLPDWVQVTFNGGSISVESEKALSNVVLEFDDGTREKWDDLDALLGESNTGEFFGRDENDGKTIVRAWVKSGCNESGDGPGYGEMFEPNIQEMAMSQFAWEDDTLTPDYDYNDFVGRLRVAETRNESNELVQVYITAKAMARATTYDASWQFNIGASFPGASDVFALVNQYYADGTPHGPQRIYWSAGGMSIPIFSPTRQALPNPPGTYTTNGLAGTDFVAGDYAEIIVILHDPQPQGTYVPMPYEPELLVETFNGDVYPIQLWRTPGDPVNEDGYPQAFVVPDTFAWPLEGEPIWNVFPEFNDWVDWINDQSLSEPKPPWWQWNPVHDSQYFQQSLFN